VHRRNRLVVEWWVQRARFVVTRDMCVGAEGATGRKFLRKTALQIVEATVAEARKQSVSANVVKAEISVWQVVCESKNNYFSMNAGIVQNERPTTRSCLWRSQGWHTNGKARVLDEQERIAKYTATQEDEAPSLSLEDVVTDLVNTRMLCLHQCS